MLFGPSNGMPEHRILYLKYSTNLVAILNSTKLEPEEDDSTILFLLE